MPIPSLRLHGTLAGVLLMAGGSALAADWADNSIGYRYGTKFAEPFNTQDISKNIVNFQHASGTSTAPTSSTSTC